MSMEPYKSEKTPVEIFNEPYICIGLVWNLKKEHEIQTYDVDMNRDVWKRSDDYGVASVSRIDKIKGLFCKRAL